MQPGIFLSANGTWDLSVSSMWCPSIAGDLEHHTGPQNFRCFRAAGVSSTYVRGIPQPQQRYEIHRGRTSLHEFATKENGR
jgi:hypothetical protein